LNGRRLLWFAFLYAAGLATMAAGALALKYVLGL
jgi:hypothetical protein